MKNDKKVTHVFITTDYEKFKTLKGNRNINGLHLRRLKESMQEQQLISPIIVNEKYEIIDGQHRYTACKELGLPLYYILLPGYSLKEVQRLNTNMSNWKKADYLAAFCDLGYPEYIRFRKFRKDYPKFSINVAENLLTNSVSFANKSSGGHTEFKFTDGTFKIKNYAKAEDMAKKLLQISDFYDGYNRRSFVNAMIFIFDHPNYDHKKFMQRLKANRTMMIHQINVEQYKVLVEKIYNYRSPNKVNLRFK